MIFEGGKHDGVVEDQQTLEVVSCEWFWLDHHGEKHLKYEVDEYTNCS